MRDATAFREKQDQQGYRPYKEGQQTFVGHAGALSSVLHVRQGDGHSAFLPPPSSEDLNSFYNGGFAEGENPVYNLDAQFHPDVIEVARGVEQHMMQLGGLAPDFTYHDFGTAFGALVWAFQTLGHRATGHDANEKWVEAGRRWCGESLSSGDPEAALARLPYDVDLVTALHVLEHLVDPAAALTAIRRKLSRNGLVYICTPNAASVQYALGGRDKDQYYTFPGHLQYFTPKSMLSHVRSAGLQPLVMETRWLDDPRFGIDYVVEALGDPGAGVAAQEALRLSLINGLFGQEIFVIAGLPSNDRCWRDPAIDMKAEWAHQLVNPALHIPAVGSAHPGLDTRWRARLPPRLRFFLGHARRAIGLGPRK